MGTPWRRFVQLLLVWALLLAALYALQRLVVAHLEHARGTVNGFAPPIRHADVPILGVNVALEQYSEAELEQALSHVADAGFVWVRQRFVWRQIEPQPGQFDWTFPDRVIAALASYPCLRLVAVFDDDPPGPPDTARFAEFVRRFASRYASQVDYYQIWDEPNLADRWGGGPVNPPAYADLLAKSAQAIRAVDPDAVILLAGLAPTTEHGPQNLSEVRYLEELYQAGAAPYFDIIVGKPYGFDTGPDDRRVSENILNFSRFILLREVALRYGDGAKAIWASHWGWNALPASWNGRLSIWGQTTEELQARRTVAALERARAEWPWAGALILEHFQPFVPVDDPRWGFALFSPSDQPRPVYEAVRQWAKGLPDAAPPGGYPAVNNWTEYIGAWETGPLGADVLEDGARVRFRFDGSAVGVTVRRSPDPAHLYVAVDGQPANGLPRDAEGRAYLVLYDAQSTVETVRLADRLMPGPHVVEIVAEHGQGRWVLTAWHVASLVRTEYTWKIALAAAAVLLLGGMLAHHVRRFEWAACRRAFLSWPTWRQVVLMVGLVVWLWLGLALGALDDLRLEDSLSETLRDGISQWFFIAFFALPLVASSFAFRPDWGVALVTFSLPFYTLSGPLAYVALGIPAVLALLLAPAVLWLGRRERERSLGETGHVHCTCLSALDWAVSLFVLVAFIGTLRLAFFRPPGTPPALRRVSSAFQELGSLFLVPALLYAEVRQVQRCEPKALPLVVGGWLWGGVGVACVGLIQYALGWGVTLSEGGWPRLRSVYPSPNGLGLYLGRVWPLWVAFAFGSPHRRYRWLFALGAVLVLAAVVLSFSRGALLLGFPAGIALMSWLADRYRVPTAKRRYLWIALAVAAVWVLLIGGATRYVPRFASLLDWQAGSTFFRLELWRSSVALIREQPWFGVGPGQFQFAYRTRYISPRAWQEPGLAHPHNIYLDHWSRLGIWGLVVGCMLQVAFWRTMREQLRTCVRKGLHCALWVGLAGSMLVFLVHGWVDNTLFYPDMAMAFFFTLALAQADPAAIGGQIHTRRG